MGISDILGELGTFLVQAIVTAAGFYKPDATLDQIKKQTNLLMVYEGAFIVVVCLAYLFIMKEKPEQPPSKVAEEVELEDSIGMWKDASTLLKNKNFVCLMLSYSLVYAVINSMMDAISPLFSSYYAKEDFISTIALIQILTSIVTELLTGPYLDRTKRYLCTLRTTVFATLGMTFALIFIIPTGNYLMCSIGISLTGLAMGPILPVGFDFGVQLTHPVSPTLVNGFLQIAEQIGEFSISTTLVGLCSINPILALYTIFGLISVAAFASLLVKEDLRVERKDSRIIENGNDEQATKVQTNGLI
jgi:hypothetical protein